MVNSKGEDVLDTPNTRKVILIIKWAESFANFLHRIFDERKTSLSYVIRESDTVPGLALTTVRGK